MLVFDFFENILEPKVLCLGAHPDDIEIGCGGTIIKILTVRPQTDFFWVVFSGTQERRMEAQESAKCFLGSAHANFDFLQYKDSYFPFIGSAIKDYFEQLREKFCPDIIFTHCSDDAHQDHRLISYLTWNTFRDNLIIEYEIPKYDGDLTTPNLYVHLDEEIVGKKINFILKVFKSQKAKLWFSEDTFRSMLCIRGAESNAPKKYAEGFHCRKICF